MQYTHTWGAVPQVGVNDIHIYMYTLTTVFFFTSDMRDVTYSGLHNAVMGGSSEEFVGNLIDLGFWRLLTNTWELQPISALC